jgi:hypothetical protein
MRKKGRLQRARRKTGMLHDQAVRHFLKKHQETKYPECIGLYPECENLSPGETCPDCLKCIHYKKPEVIEMAEENSVVKERVTKEKNSFQRRMSVESAKQKLEVLKTKENLSKGQKAWIKIYEKIICKGEQNVKEE